MRAREPDKNSRRVKVFRPSSLNETVSSSDLVREGQLVCDVAVGSWWTRPMQRKMINLLSRLSESAWIAQFLKSFQEKQISSLQPMRINLRRRAKL